MNATRGDEETAVSVIAGLLGIFTALNVIAENPSASKLNDPASSSVTNLNDDKSVNLGGSIPLDNGRGYANGYGYFLWNRKAFPWSNTDFKLVFAGVNGDAELTFRGLLTENTDVGAGLNYQTFGRFEEYERGQIQIGNRMDMDQVSGRLFLQQHLILNYIEIAQVRATYEGGYTSYTHDDDTSSNFILAPSGAFHSLKLNAGSGKILESNYHPGGWDINLGFEATFREDWRQWGPPGLWYSPSDYQKIQCDSTYVFSSIGDQKLVSTLSGGLGNKLDRLSTFRLGSSLTGMPGVRTLHGFYVREIFADDYGLLNLDYVIPIQKEHELAFHFYGDGAVTHRSDISDHTAHGWAGTGTGMSFKAFWDTQWLMGYGYGINAQRGTDHGGQEAFVQMSKKF